jgi:hypothetical protein
VVQNAPVPQAPGTEVACDVLIVGAGLGGCAAALRAASLGRRVCLIEETGWPGGQISIQGVPSLDEHAYIETFGGTGSYYELRNRIRAYYRTMYTLSPSADAVHFNPGNAWVSSLSFEPRVGVAVLEAMMSGPHDSGDLQVFYNTRAVAADVVDARIQTVTARQLDSGAVIRFRAAFVLDATDHGDVLALTGTAYALGQESRALTGEPSAPDTPNPACIQNFTFPMAVEFRPHEDHTIPKPDGYEQNRDSQPYSLRYRPYEPDTPAFEMFTTADGTMGPFWAYRRTLDAANFADPRVSFDVSILNWTSNDYRGGAIVGRPPDEQQRRSREARQLTLGFLYWLQTEAPRDDGGTGYPELNPRPDIMGSVDGLSQAPYVREGRRLRARYTIVEQNIAEASNPGVRAAPFNDSVGIGSYPIDLHGCGDRTTDINTKPFQIPLGALVPVRTVNLLPAAKNIGTTHITNGAYRLHPIEWAVGDASGTLAALCLGARVTPQMVQASLPFTRQLQLLLIDQLVPLYWWVDVPLNHPAFGATQLLAAEGVWRGSDTTLNFIPNGPIFTSDAKPIIAAAAASVRRWKGAGAANPDADGLQPNAGDDSLPIVHFAAAQLIAIAIPGAIGPPTTAPPAQAMTRADLAVWLGAIVRNAIEGGTAQPTP